MVEAVHDTPNLYFVLDASGSMNALASEDATRYMAVRDAAVDLVQNLGPLIRVGAAVFPGESATDGCEAGEEVFAMTQGDLVSTGEGPTTKAFRKAILREPFGGTPTAATIAALTAHLTSLPGRTVVLLATDGGPNCNAGASCDAEHCIANIEHDPGDLGCYPDQNCCDPDYYTAEMCLDEDATVEAIGGLSAAGVAVYVIGIPGSETYGAVLDHMAEAAGTAAPAPSTTSYYRVDDLDGLGAVLSSIAGVAISCDFELASAPPQKDLTNVYLDRALLPQDPVDGWAFTSDTTIALLGEACVRLKTGQVKEVQIVAGCPTEGPK
jgi:hypothetical protein